MARALDRLSFAETIENHPDGIALVDDKIEIKDCNDTFRRMTGIGEGSLERFDSLVHPTHFQAWSSEMARFLSDRSETHRLILRIKKESGSYRWIRFSFLPLASHCGFLILLSDITGQKRLEMKLVRARDQAEKATQSKSDFLANTSHEIRTPIHTVISTAELLAETSLDQEQSDYLSGIQFAAEVLLTLIDDILDLSKIEAGQLSLERTGFNLIDMLEDSVDMMTLEAHKKNLDIGLYTDPKVPINIYGDPTRLRQVVVNLVNNAVKFTHEGEVILDVETVDVNPQTVRLKFAVVDSGIGISLDKQENLFEAFHQADSSTTRRFGGTGLGLFISRSIVSQMGGILSFSSEPGRGSSFFFEIEFDRADGDAVLLPNLPQGFFDGRRVLIVDDSDAVRDRLGRTLRSWGMEVDEADGAEKALLMMRRVKEPAYELIIVDQTMPHIDGWQFASEVHSDEDILQPPMVLMSMKGGRGTVEAKMRLLGWFQSYLTKPVRRKELASALFRLLSHDFDLEEVGNLDPSVDPVLESGRTILIAEDHEVNRGLLKAILEKNGHEVFQAADGREAHEIAMRENPDLIFMDCQMPLMNGYESTKLIRQQGYDGPIVAVTASALAEERDRCLDSGMNDLVTKPFKQADILKMMEWYLGVGRTFSRPPALGRSTRVSYSELPIFDFVAAVKTFLGNEETVRALLGPHMIKIKGEIETIADAIGKGDWEATSAAAHSIKGSCLNMDMVRCGQAAADIEAAAIAADETRAVLSFARLRQEYPVLKATVDEILSRLSRRDRPTL